MTTIQLADAGLAVNLIQQACIEDDGTGPRWEAWGYLSTDVEDDETGPTVRVQWAPVDDEDAQEVDWARPISVWHYSRGELLLRD